MADPDAWATDPTSPCQSPAAQPWVPSSKLDSVCGSVGLGLTITVIVARLDRRPSVSRTTYGVCARPTKPSAGVKWTLPLSHVRNVPPPTVLVRWRPAVVGSRSTLQARMRAPL